MNGRLIFLPKKFCFPLRKKQKVDFSMLKKNVAFTKVVFKKSHALISFNGLKFQLYCSGKVGYVFLRNVGDFLFLEDFFKEFWDNHLKHCIVEL